MRPETQAALAAGKPNSQYNLTAPDSYSQKVAERQRRAMYERFIAECAPRAGETILDVGVTSDQTYRASNYLEAWYPDKSAITAAGVDDASFLEQLYPGMRFVHADGCDLPFDDGSFDHVHSSAVLEHVGALDRQRRLIAECARAAKKTVFLTTPNRWFPVEVHTALPLIHWLPAPVFRAILDRAGLPFFAREENLNLMSRRVLTRLTAGIPGFDWTVAGVSLIGFTSNLLVIGRRKP
jgi:ubiquinone/menaquinone biosynthesis C-methylase UbiE